MQADAGPRALKVSTTRCPENVEWMIAHGLEACLTDDTGTDCLYLHEVGAKGIIGMNFGTRRRWR